MLKKNKRCGTDFERGEMKMIRINRKNRLGLCLLLGALLVSNIKGRAESPSPQAKLSVRCSRAFKQWDQLQFIETLTRYSQREHKSLEHKNFKEEVTALSQNYQSSPVAIFRTLIHKGFIKRVQGGPNPLFDYILYRDIEEISALIKKDPSLLYKGTLFHFSPVFLITFLGYESVLKLALSIDPHLSRAENIFKETPLHIAIDPWTTQFLLEQGANPNAQDKQGHAPLNNSRDVDITKILLRHQADPSLKARSGMHLIAYHKKFVQNPEIIQLLESALADQKTSTKVRKRPKLIPVRKKVSATPAPEQANTRAPNPQVKRSKPYQKRNRRSAPDRQKIIDHRDSAKAQIIVLQRFLTTLQLRKKFWGYIIKLAPFLNPTSQTEQISKANAIVSTIDQAIKQTKEELKAKQRIIERLNIREDHILKQKSSLQ